MRSFFRRFPRRRMVVDWVLIALIVVICMIAVNALLWLLSQPVFWVLLLVAVVAWMLGKQSRSGR